MSGLLPSEAEVDPPEGEPRVVGVDSDDAERVLSALSSGTARRLLAALHDAPATPSELADDIDTSLQNAQYHISKLEDADLIRIHDTRYSEKGREMKVYAPADGALVLFAGDDDESDGVQDALAALLGAVGLLGVVSVAVQVVFGNGFAVPSAPGVEGGSSGAISAADLPEGAGVLANMPPGLVFFLGGLLAIAAVAAAVSLRK